MSETGSVDTVVITGLELRAKGPHPVSGYDGTFCDLARAKGFRFLGGHVRRIDIHRDCVVLRKLTTTA